MRDKIAKRNRSKSLKEIDRLMFVIVHEKMIFKGILWSMFVIGWFQVAYDGDQW